MYFKKLFLSCVFIVCVKCQSSPLVKISQGEIEGLVESDGSFGFHGIPYAGFTEGENRFKAPGPAPNFPGVFKAVDTARVCAQPAENGFTGDENCLVLNVLTKNLTSPKPVLVVIKGEDFATTDTRTPYKFSKLVQRDIVVVTVNYRLSIFGFLCLGVEQAPGNAGLKDIIAALKWINLNIAAFGGDPNNVVLFGHGSGGALVDIITLSPRSQGLVHKAISASGNALAPWAVSVDPVNNAIMVGEKLQYTKKSNYDLAESFRKTQFPVFGSALYGFNNISNEALFAPCIENPDIDPNNTVLIDSPINILRSGNFSQIPYIYGFGNRDGTIRVKEGVFGDWFTKMNNLFSQALPLDLSVPANNLTAVSQNVKTFYFDSDSVNLTTIDDYFDYHGDTMFVYSSVRSAKERSLKSSQPVYLYELAFKGTLNTDWAYPGVEIRGAKYGSILNFLFDYDVGAENPATQIRENFIAFMKSSVPPAVWRSITDATKQLEYLRMEGDTTNGITKYEQATLHNPHSERVQFWDNLYQKYYSPPKSAFSGATTITSTFSFLLVVFTVLYIC